MVRLTWHGLVCSKPWFLCLPTGIASWLRSSLSSFIRSTLRGRSHAHWRVQAPLGPLPVTAGTMTLPYQTTSIPALTVECYRPATPPNFCPENWWRKWWPAAQVRGWGRDGLQDWVKMWSKGISRGGEKEQEAQGEGLVQSYLRQLQAEEQKLLNEEEKHLSTNFNTSCE